MTDLKRRPSAKQGKADPKLVAYLARRKDVLEGKDERAKDLAVPCDCGAGRGRRCRGTKPTIVHFGRRLRRLLAGLR